MTELKNQQSLPLWRRWFARGLRPATYAVALLVFGLSTNGVVAQEGQETSALEIQEVPEIPALEESERREYPDLERAIDQVLADSELQRAKVGVHVEDASTGEVLYSHLGDEPLN